MKPIPTLHRFYEFFPALSIIANASGYALAVHGSLARDIDLIAVPWTPVAVSAQDLITRLIAGRATEENWPAWRLFANDPQNPSKRAHGRLAWTIQLAGLPRTYLDISVMPRMEADTERSRMANAIALYGRLEPHGA